MSKYIKNLLSEDVRQRLQGADAALLVSMIGLDANTSNRLRRELHSKNIQVMVVKNSLAARAVAGTNLAPLFNAVAGSTAICWGSEDVVSLAKEVIRLSKDKKYDKFAPRGGVMEGEQLTAEQVAQVSKWPNRAEQLSILVGQILGPGSRLAAQLLAPGGALASQIKQKGEGEEAESETKEGGEQPAESPAAG
jgi:large subunit ribosomal protein L10